MIIIITWLVTQNMLITMKQRIEGTHLDALKHSKPAQTVWDLSDVQQHAAIREVLPSWVQSVPIALCNPLKTIPFYILKCMSQVQHTLQQLSYSDQIQVENLWEICTDTNTNNNQNGRTPATRVAQEPKVHCLATVDTKLLCYCQHK